MTRAFAADFTRLRQENDKFGRRRVQQGLMQKGVHPELVLYTGNRVRERE